jgi:hypothetical protein
MLCRMIRIRDIVRLDYIGLDTSESENAVGFVRTSCRCGLVSGCGKTVT